MAKVLRFVVTASVLVLLLLLMEGAALASAQTATASKTWSITGSLNVSRLGSTMTLLSNGKVLVAGGFDSNGNPLHSAELYDPATGKWSLTGSMHVARANHAAKQLANGKVLVAGGTNSANPVLASAELYDPTTGTWSLTGSMNVARENHSASFLPNGKILVAGGDDNAVFPANIALASAELYDPATGKWSLTGSLHVARFNHPAVRLTNGEILVSGGDDSGGDCCSISSHAQASSKHDVPLSPCFCPHATATAELYDQATGKWTLTGNLNMARDLHKETLLPNGKVLVSGGLQCNPYSGECTTYASAELYDPTTGTWSFTGSMQSARYDYTATRLTDGTILIAGGHDNNGNILASAELYDPTMGTWSSTGSMNVARSHFTAERLTNGQVLVTAGGNASAELYTP